MSVRFLGESEDTIRHFEINWPLGFKVQGDIKYVPMYVGPFFRHQNGKGSSTPVVSNWKVNGIKTIVS